MLNQDKGNLFARIFDYLHERIIAVIIIVAILAGVICMVVILNGRSTVENENTQITEYKAMKTVYFAMDEVSSLNPLSSTAEDTHYLSKLVFSSLFKFDDGLNLKKDLVKEYSTSAKEGTVKITLKDGVTFTDDTSLTAYDVRFTVEQILSIGSKSPYYTYASKIDYVEVLSDKQLKIYFKRASDAALDNLTFPIVSSNSYSRDEKKPVGTGPYSYGSYKNQKVLTLKANKDYYGTVPQNTLQFKVIEDKTKVPGLMSIDSITAAVTTENAVAIEAEDKGLQVQQVPSNEVEYIGFNFKNTYLKDVNVRQAIAKAVNCQSIINDSYAGAGMTCDSIYYPGFLGTENGGDAYEQDLVSAHELLKSCGYVDQDENGYLETKKGKEIKLTILVNKNNDSRVDAAQTIAENLHEIGIRADVDAVSWKAYKKALNKKDFDLYLGGYQFDAKYNLKEMFAKGNKISYNNEDVLKYVGNLETALSADKQKETFGKLKPILIEEIPYYCICYKTYSFMSVERFTAETIPTFFDRYRGCGQWQRERVLTTEVEPEEEVEEDTEN